MRRRVVCRRGECRCIARLPGAVAAASLAVAIATRAAAAAPVFDDPRPPERHPAEFLAAGLDRAAVS